MAKAVVVERCIGKVDGRSSWRRGGRTTDRQGDKGITTVGCLSVYQTPETRLTYKTEEVRRADLSAPPVACLFSLTDRSNGSACILSECDMARA